MDFSIVTLGFIILILLAIALLFVLQKYLNTSSLKKPYQHRQSKQAAKKPVPCIICGNLLEKGMKLISGAVIAGTEEIVFVYGCPACYGEKAYKTRSCPTCGKQLEKTDHMIGKMRRTEKRKPQLIISGCSYCAYRK